MNLFLIFGENQRKKIVEAIEAATTLTSPAFQTFMVWARLRERDKVATFACDMDDARFAEGNCTHWMRKTECEPEKVCKAIGIACDLTLNDLHDLVDSLEYLLQSRWHQSAQLNGLHTQRQRALMAVIDAKLKDSKASEE